MEELEYYSSNQVARELDIELALLQRLSGLIEKTLMNTDYFYRDKRNKMNVIEDYTRMPILMSWKRS